MVPLVTRLPWAISLSVGVGVAVALSGCAPARRSQPPGPTLAYDGPPRPPEEVANIIADGSIRITHCDGERTFHTYKPLPGPSWLSTVRTWAFRVQVLPGQHTLTVRHMYEPPVGTPLGGVFEYTAPMNLRFTAMPNSLYVIKMQLACRDRSFGRAMLDGALDAIPGVDPEIGGVTAAWIVHAGSKTVVAGTAPPGVDPFMYKTPESCAAAK
jgi:hypothetical protein